MIFKLLVVFLSLASILHAHDKKSNVSSIKEQINKLQKELAKSNWNEAYQEYKQLYKSNIHCPCDKKFPKLCDFHECKDEPIEVDYIVCGGGIAGSVLANRLSEPLGNKVMLIERGGRASKLSQVPGLFVFGSLTKYSDRYCLEPQRNFGKALEKNRVIAYGGKAIGGFSTLSSGRMSKGQKSDFEKWGKGWCYDDIVEYFLKSEKANLTGNVNSAYHNFDGRLSNSDNPTSNLGEAFIKCGHESGLKLVDPTGDLNEGVSRIPANLGAGTRQDHAMAFLDSISNRPNLIIKEHSQVYKILINDHKVAYGVKYVHNGKIYTVKAKKEVIICHGTFGSPKLLMHSGIGPSKQLKKYGIKCIKDLPVGKVMNDQISYVGLGFCAKDCPSNMHDIINNKTIHDYINYGKGPLSIANNVDAIAYKAIGSSHINTMIRTRGRFYSTDKGHLLRKTSGISKRFYKKYFKRFEGKRMCSIVPTLVAKSKGYLKLKSNNPFEDLRIYGNYFSDPGDKKNMVKAIKYILDLVKCPSMKKLDFKYHHDKIPECRHHKDDDKYWNCAVEYLTVSNQDFSGTCKMGPAEDCNSVVDFNLRVIGIRGLRVVDSSIYPQTVTGPTGGISTMVAEKAAYMIKEADGIVVRKVCDQKSAPVKKEKEKKQEKKQDKKKEKKQEKKQEKKEEKKEEMKEEKKQEKKKEQKHHSDEGHKLYY